MEDLEFYTNAELIKELVGRASFVGVVIFSEQQRLIKNEPLKNFNVASSVNTDALVDILGNVIVSLETDNFEENTLGQDEL